MITAIFVGITLLFPSVTQPLIYLSGLLYTVPSLALFILLIPFTGLSIATSIIGLTLYSVVIIFRNVIVGFEKIPKELLEVSEALGYMRWYRFVDVEFHIILPSLFAGLRIASVSLVGLVEITALIGQGGLGQLVISGFNQDFLTPIIISLSLCVILSFMFDLLIYKIEYWLTPWNRL